MGELMSRRIGIARLPGALLQQRGSACEAEFTIHHPTNSPIQRRPALA